MATKRQGFTLIELLVVIAIIAILAAILFPVFARAKAKAQETQCLNNIKQIATAVLTYCSDYDQFAPLQFSGNYDDDPPGVQDVWYLLRDYLKTTQILQCPVAKDAADMTGVPHLDSLSTSYAVNGLQVTGDVDGDGDSNDGPTDGVFYYKIEMDSPWYSSPYPGYASPWENMCSIEFLAQPAQTYMAWDAKITYPTGWTDWTAIDDLALCNLTRMCKKFGSCTTNSTGGTVFLDPDFRHGGKHDRCNFAFMDGHAKSLDRSQAETAGWATWDVND